MRQARSWRILWILPALLALAGGTCSLWQLSRASTWFRHTADVRLALARFLSTVVDAEGSVGRHAMTRDPQSAIHYHRAESTWRNDLSSVRALTSDNEEQQARVARLDALAEAEFQSLAAVYAAIEAHADGVVLDRAMRTTDQLDGIRQLVRALEGEEARLDGVRRQELIHRWRVTLLVFVTIGLFFLGFVVVEWWQRHRAQKRHLASEDRFRFMVENVKDYAIITLDRDGRVATWNRGAQEIKGWTADQIIGQHFSRFYPEEDIKAGKIERELETVAREGRFEEEGWRVRADGSRFWANVVINAILDDKGHLVGYTKVTRDLTERKKAAQALAEEQERRVVAERESRFAQMFIAVLGHDLRNPLNAISMGARLLKKKVGRADPKVIDRITTSADRMTVMVNQLLDLSRNRLGGGIAVDKRETDVAEIVSGAIEELRLVHADRDIRWTGQARCRCAWDAGRMAQVVSNLVGNALEHSPAASPVTVGLESVAGEVVLTVHNEGPAIPPDLLACLFDPYRRNSVRSERSKGLGLGLFITQQLVRAHGGRIDVRSSDAEGTTFTVVVPCTAPKVAATDELRYGRTTR